MDTQEGSYFKLINNQVFEPGQTPHAMKGIVRRYGSETPFFSAPGMRSELVDGEVGYETYVDGARQDEWGSYKRRLERVTIDRGDARVSVPGWELTGRAGSTVYLTWFGPRKSDGPPVEWARMGLNDEIKMTSTPPPTSTDRGVTTVWEKKQGEDTVMWSMSDGQGRFVWIHYGLDFESNPYHNSNGVVRTYIDGQRMGVRSFAVDSKKKWVFHRTDDFEFEGETYQVEKSGVSKGQVKFSPEIAKKYRNGYTFQNGERFTLLTPVGVISKTDVVVKGMPKVTIHTTVTKRHVKNTLKHEVKTTIVEHWDQAFLKISDLNSVPIYQVGTADNGSMTLPRGVEGVGVIMWHPDGSVTNTMEFNKVPAHLLFDPQNLKERQQGPSSFFEGRLVTMGPEGAPRYATTRCYFGKDYTNGARIVIYGMAEGKVFIWQPDPVVGEESGQKGGNSKSPKIDNAMGQSKPVGLSYQRGTRNGREGTYIELEGRFQINDSQLQPFDDASSISWRGGGQLAVNKLNVGDFVDLRLSSGQTLRLAVGDRVQVTSTDTGPKFTLLESGQGLSGEDERGSHLVDASGRRENIYTQAEQRFLPTVGRWFKKPENIVATVVFVVGLVAAAPIAPAWLATCSLWIFGTAKAATLAVYAKSLLLVSLMSAFTGYNLGSAVKNFREGNWGWFGLDILFAFIPAGSELLAYARGGWAAAKMAGQEGISLSKGFFTRIHEANQMYVACRQAGLLQGRAWWFVGDKGAEAMGAAIKGAAAFNVKTAGQFIVYMSAFRASGETGLLGLKNFTNAAHQARAENLNDLRAFVLAARQLEIKGFAEIAQKGLAGALGEKAKDFQAFFDFFKHSFSETTRGTQAAASGASAAGNLSAKNVIQAVREMAGSGVQGADLVSKISGMSHLSAAEKVSVLAQVLDKTGKSAEFMGLLKQLGKELGSNGGAIGKLIEKISSQEVAGKLFEILIAKPGRASSLGFLAGLTEEGVQGLVSVLGKDAAAGHLISLLKSKGGYEFGEIAVQMFNKGGQGVVTFFESATPKTITALAEKAQSFLRGSVEMGKSFFGNLFGALESTNTAGTFAALLGKIEIQGGLNAVRGFLSGLSEGGVSNLTALLGKGANGKLFQIAGEMAQSGGMMNLARAISEGGEFTLAFFEKADHTLIAQFFQTFKRSQEAVGGLFRGLSQTAGDAMGRTVDRFTDLLKNHASEFKTMMYGFGRATGEAVGKMAEQFGKGIGNFSDTTYGVFAKQMFPAGGAQRLITLFVAGGEKGAAQLVQFLSDPRLEKSEVELFFAFTARCKEPVIKDIVGVALASPTNMRDLLRTFRNAAHMPEASMVLAQYFTSGGDVGCLIIQKLGATGVNNLGNALVELTKGVNSGAITTPIERIFSDFFGPSLKSLAKGGEKALTKEMFAQEVANIFNAAGGGRLANRLASPKLGEYMGRLAAGQGSRSLTNFLSTSVLRAADQATPGTKTLLGGLELTEKAAATLTYLGGIRPGLGQALGDLAGRLTTPEAQKAFIAMLENSDARILGHFISSIKGEGVETLVRILSSPEASGSFLSVFSKLEATGAERLGQLFNNLVKSEQGVAFFQALKEAGGGVQTFAQALNTLSEKGFANLKSIFQSDALETFAKILAHSPTDITVTFQLLEKMTGAEINSFLQAVRELGIENADKLLPLFKNLNGAGVETLVAVFKNAEPAVLAGFFKTLEKSGADVFGRMLNRLTPDGHKAIVSFFKALKGEGAELFAKVLNGGVNAEALKALFNTLKPEGVKNFALLLNQAAMGSRSAGALIEMMGVLNENGGKVLAGLLNEGGKAVENLTAALKIFGGWGAKDSAKVFGQVLNGLEKEGAEIIAKAFAQWELQSVKNFAGLVAKAKQAEAIIGFINGAGKMQQGAKFFVEFFQAVEGKAVKTLALLMAKLDRAGGEQLARLFGNQVKGAVEFLQVMKKAHLAGLAGFLNVAKAEETAFLTKLMKGEAREGVLQLFAKGGKEAGQGLAWMLRSAGPEGFKCFETLIQSEKSVVAALTDALKVLGSSEKAAGYLGQVLSEMKPAELEGLKGLLQAHGELKAGGLLALLFPSLAKGEGGVFLGRVFQILSEKGLNPAEVRQILATLAKESAGKQAGMLLQRALCKEGNIALGSGRDISQALRRVMGESSNGEYVAGLFKGLFGGPGEVAKGSHEAVKDTLKILLSSSSKLSSAQRNAIKKALSAYRNTIDDDFNALLKISLTDRWGARGVVQAVGNRMENVKIIVTNPALYYRTWLATSAGWATFGFLGVGTLIPFGYDPDRIDEKGNLIRGRGWYGLKFSGVGWRLWEIFDPHFFHPFKKDASGRSLEIGFGEAAAIVFTKWWDEDDGDYFSWRVDSFKQMFDQGRRVGLLLTTLAFQPTGNGLLGMLGKTAERGVGATITRQVTKVINIPLGLLDRAKTFINFRPVQLITRGSNRFWVGIKNWGIQRFNGFMTGSSKIPLMRTSWSVAFQNVVTRVIAKVAGKQAAESAFSKQFVHVLGTAALGWEGVMPFHIATSVGTGLGTGLGLIWAKTQTDDEEQQRKLAVTWGGLGGNLAMLIVPMARFQSVAAKRILEIEGEAVAQGQKPSLEARQLASAILRGETDVTLGSARLKLTGEDILSLYKEAAKIKVSAIYHAEMEAAAAPGQPAGAESRHGNKILQKVRDAAAQQGSEKNTNIARLRGFNHELMDVDFNSTTFVEAVREHLTREANPGDWGKVKCNKEVSAGEERELRDQVSVMEDYFVREELKKEKLAGLGKKSTDVRRIEEVRRIDALSVEDAKKELAEVRISRAKEEAGKSKESTASYYYKGKPVDSKEPCAVEITPDLRDFALARQNAEIIRLMGGDNFQRDPNDASDPIFALAKEDNVGKIQGASGLLKRRQVTITWELKNRAETVLANREAYHEKDKVADLQEAHSSTIIDAIQEARDELKRQGVGDDVLIKVKESILPNVPIRDWFNEKELWGGESGSKKMPGLGSMTVGELRQLADLVKSNPELGNDIVFVLHMARQFAERNQTFGWQPGQLFGAIVSANYTVNMAAGGGKTLIIQMRAILEALDTSKGQSAVFVISENKSGVDNDMGRGKPFDLEKTASSLGIDVIRLDEQLKLVEEGKLTIGDLNKKLLYGKRFGDRLLRNIIAVDFDTLGHALSRYKSDGFAYAYYNTQIRLFNEGHRVTTDPVMYVIGEADSGKDGRAAGRLGKVYEALHGLESATTAKTNESHVGLREINGNLTLFIRGEKTGIKVCRSLSEFKALGESEAAVFIDPTIGQAGEAGYNRKAAPILRRGAGISDNSAEHLDGNELKSFLKGRLVAEHFIEAETAYVENALVDNKREGQYRPVQRGLGVRPEQVIEDVAYLMGLNARRAEAKRLVSFEVKYSAESGQFQVLKTLKGISRYEFFERTGEALNTKATKFRGFTATAQGYEGFMKLALGAAVVNINANTIGKTLRNVDRFKIFGNSEEYYTEVSKRVVEIAEKGNKLNDPQMERFKKEPTPTLKLSPDKDNTRVLIGTEDKALMIAVEKALEESGLTVRLYSSEFVINKNTGEVVSAAEKGITVDLAFISGPGSEKGGGQYKALKRVIDNETPDNLIKPIVDSFQEGYAICISNQRGLTGQNYQAKGTVVLADAKVTTGEIIQNMERLGRINEGEGGGRFVVAREVFLRSDYLSIQLENVYTNRKEFGELLKSRVENVEEGKSASLTERKTLLVFDRFIREVERVKGEEGLRDHEAVAEVLKKWSGERGVAGLENLTRLSTEINLLERNTDVAKTVSNEVFFHYDLGRALNEALHVSRGGDRDILEAFEKSFRQQRHRSQEEAFEGHEMADSLTQLERISNNSRDRCFVLLVNFLRGEGARLSRPVQRILEAQLRNLKAAGGINFKEVVQDIHDRKGRVLLETSFGNAGRDRKASAEARFIEGRRMVFDRLKYDIAPSTDGGQVKNPRQVVQLAREFRRRGVSDPALQSVLETLSNNSEYSYESDGQRMLTRRGQAYGTTLLQAAALDDDKKIAALRNLLSEIKLDGGQTLADLMRPALWQTAPKKDDALDRAVTLVNMLVGQGVIDLERGGRDFENLLRFAAVGAANPEAMRGRELTVGKVRQFLRAGVVGFDMIKRSVEDPESRGSQLQQVMPQLEAAQARAPMAAFLGWLVEGLKDQKGKEVTELKREAADFNRDVKAAQRFVDAQFLPSALVRWVRGTASTLFGYLKTPLKAAAFVAGGIVKGAAAVGKWIWSGSKTERTVKVGVAVAAGAALVLSVGVGAIASGAAGLVSGLGTILSPLAIPAVCVVVSLLILKRFSAQQRLAGAEARIGREVRRTVQEFQQSGQGNERLLAKLALYGLGRLGQKEEDRDWSELSLQEKALKVMAILGGLGDAAKVARSRLTLGDLLHLAGSDLIKVSWLGMKSEVKKGAENFRSAFRQWLAEAAKTKRDKSPAFQSFLNILPTFIQVSPLLIQLFVGPVGLGTFIGLSLVGSMVGKLVGKKDLFTGLLSKVKEKFKGPEGAKEKGRGDAEEGKVEPLSQGWLGRAGFGWLGRLLGARGDKKLFDVLTVLFGWQVKKSEERKGQRGNLEELIKGKDQQALEDYLQQMQEEKVPAENYAQLEGAFQDEQSQDMALEASGFTPAEVTQIRDAVKTVTLEGRNDVSPMAQENRRGYLGQLSLEELAGDKDQLDIRVHQLDFKGVKKALTEARAAQQGQGPINIDYDAIAARYGMEAWKVRAVDRLIALAEDGKFTPHWVSEAARQVNPTSPQVVEDFLYKSLGVNPAIAKENLREIAKAVSRELGLSNGQDDNMMWALPRILTVDELEEYQAYRGFDVVRCIGRMGAGLMRGWREDLDQTLQGADSSPYHAGFLFGYTKAGQAGRVDGFYDQFASYVVGASDEKKAVILSVLKESFGEKDHQVPWNLQGNVGEIREALETLHASVILLDLKAELKKAGLAGELLDVYRALGTSGRVGTGTASLAALLASHNLGQGVDLKGYLKFYVVGQPMRDLIRDLELVVPPLPGSAGTTSPRSPPSPTSPQGRAPAPSSVVPKAPPVRAAGILPLDSSVPPSVAPAPISSNMQSPPSSGVQVPPEETPPAQTNLNGSKTKSGGLSYDDRKGLGALHRAVPRLEDGVFDRYKGIFGQMGRIFNDGDIDAEATKKRANMVVVRDEDGRVVRFGVLDESQNRWVLMEKREDEVVVRRLRPGRVPMGLEISFYRWEKTGRWDQEGQLYKAEQPASARKGRSLTPAGARIGMTLLPLMAVTAIAVGITMASAVIAPVYGAGVALAMMSGLSLGGVGVVIAAAYLTTRIVRSPQDRNSREPKPGMEGFLSEGYRPIQNGEGRLVALLHPDVGNVKAKGAEGLIFRSVQWVAEEAGERVAVIGGEDRAVRQVQIKLDRNQTLEHATPLMEELAVALAAVNGMMTGEFTGRPSGRVVRAMEAILRDAKLGPMARRIDLAPLFTEAVRAKLAEVLPAESGRALPRTLREVADMAASSREFKAFVYQLVAFNGESLATEASVVMPLIVYKRLVAEMGFGTLQQIDPVRGLPVLSRHDALAHRFINQALEEMGLKDESAPQVPIVVTSKDGKVHVLSADLLLRRQDEGAAPRRQLIMPTASAPELDVSAWRALPSALRDRFGAMVKWMRGGQSGTFFVEGQERLANAALQLGERLVVINQQGLLSPQEISAVWTMVQERALRGEQASHSKLVEDLELRSGIALQQYIDDCGKEVRWLQGAPLAFAQRGLMPIVGLTMHEFLTVAAIPKTSVDANKEWILEQLNKALDLKLIDAREARRQAARLERAVRAQWPQDLYRPILALFRSEAVLRAAIQSVNNKTGAVLTYNDFLDALGDAKAWNRLAPKERSALLRVLVPVLGRAIINEMRVPLTSNLDEWLDKIEVEMMDEKDLPPAIMGRNAAYMPETGRILIGASADAPRALEFFLGRLAHEVGEAVSDMVLPRPKVEGGLGHPRAIEEAFVFYSVSRALRRFHLEAVANVVDLATAREVVKLQDRKLLAVYEAQIPEGRARVQWFEDARRIWLQSKGLHLAVVLTQKHDTVLARLGARYGIPVVSVEQINQLPETRGEAKLQTYARLYWCANQAKVMVAKPEEIQSIISVLNPRTHAYEILQGLWVAPTRALTEIFNQRFLTLLAQQA
ncbi:MAG: hypothetical protein LHV69_07210 [Elusimicrobia bacterium]|nr:hypothetical protein [Candidatus Obscuribacterium magneticum]